MGKPAARVGDMHVCPMINALVPHVGGPVMPVGVPNVLIGGLPAATLGDMCVCVGPPDVIVLGSTGVLIGGKPAARMGDMTSHGGAIVLGCFTVLIGETMPGAGGAGTGGSPGADNIIKIGARQAKDNANAAALKKAANNDEDTADKTTRDDYTAKFTLKDEAGKPVSGKKYEITSADGKVHDGKTNSNGETEQITGYTTSDCSIVFLN